MAKMYRINSRMAFNLGSMITHVWCLSYDFRDGLIKEPIECCGRILKSEDDCIDLVHELEELPGYVGDFVTGKQYGWIKRITEERCVLRYAACINAGMSENDAAYAFMN